MVKIIVNNTATAINLDIGITVPASGQTTLQPSDFIEAADSDELVELIGNGNISISDGNEVLNKAQGMALILSGFRKTDFDDDLIESNRLKVDVTGTLGDGRVKVTGADASADFLNQKIISGSSKLSKTVNNAGSAEELQLDVNPSAIGTSELNNDANFINSSQAPVQPSDIANFETSAQLNVRDTANRNRSNHTGTQLASTISDFASAVQAAETVTNLSFNNTTKVLTFVNEAGTSQSVDLTQFLDDTNLARIVGGTLNATTGIATFTRDDNTTFTIDMSSLNDQAFITNAINTHEASINNHDDVDTTTNAPSVGDLLTYDGNNWIPKRKTYRRHIRTISGEINQLNSLENFLTLSGTIPETGLYKISWTYTWSVNTTGNDFIAQVQVNNSTTIHTHQQEAKDSAGGGVTLPNTEGGNTNSSTNQRYTCSGHDIITVNAGAFTVDLDWRGEIFDIEPAIYKATLSIEEWEE